MSFCCFFYHPEIISDHARPTLRTPSWIPNLKTLAQRFQVYYAQKHIREIGHCSFNTCHPLYHIFVVLVPRCVPGSQGSFALGVQQIITRILAFIPAPIVYGALLDSVCLLSESDPCNEDVERNCLEYRNDGLRYGFGGLEFGLITPWSNKNES